MFIEYLKLSYLRVLSGLHMSLGESRFVSSNDEHSSAENRRVVEIQLADLRSGAMEEEIMPIGK